MAQEKGKVQEQPGERVIQCCPLCGGKFGEPLPTGVTVQCGDPESPDDPGCHCEFKVSVKSMPANEE